MRDGGGVVDQHAAFRIAHFDVSFLQHVEFFQCQWVSPSQSNKENGTEIGNVGKGGGGGGGGV